MKRKCLRCETEFDAVRDSAKFCSANCRVKWNYKNKSTKKQISFSVVENRVLELLDKLESKLILSQTLPESYDGKKFDKINFDEPTQWKEKKRTVIRSFENYAALRKECENDEDWEKLKQEILNADNLTTKQRILLTT
jgi:hypothetical protein